MLKKTTAATAILALVCGGSMVFAQGSLTPPAGAPGATFKTLTQIEPRTPVNTLAGDANAKHTIGKPGSYYLTGSITGAANLSAINITTEGVTLDLGGFELIGVAQSQFGVVVNATKTVIRNGTIRNWDSSGIFGGRMCTIEYVSAFANKNAGISVSDQSYIRKSFIHNNKGSGISAGAASIVEDCRLTSNTASGISTDGEGGQIRNCVIQFNDGNGISQSNGGSWIIENNTISSNAFYGINAGSRNVIRGNVINFNGQGTVGTYAGINLRLGGNRVEDNQLNGNHYGIYAANNPGKEFVIRNTVTGSEVSNYNGNGGNNAATFGPVSTTVVGATNPTTNFSF